jgi:3-oxoacyl-[acyl-carrier-protein] synthase II
MGEGAAILVLEEMERARSRGARIYAEVCGYGMSADAFHISAPEPSGLYAARAMTASIREAGLEPSDIDYINAHGTSTPLGDEIETRVIKTALGSHAGSVAISSTKSMTGHCLGAAGALEAVACTMAIDTGMIPPTINLDNPCPECDLDYVPNQARSRDVKVAASNSFGFGGHNVTLLFKAP